MRQSILATFSISLLSTQVACDVDVDSAAATESPADVDPPQDQLRSNPNLLTLEQLGAAIFFDEDLSTNFNLACAGCHDPAVGYTGPDLVVNLAGGIYKGSVHDRYGNRKAPSSAYNVFAPIFSLTGDGFVGGNFWDGRATGWRLGVAAADQAQGPFLNPVEQALEDGSIVVDRVCHSSYRFAFKWLWGPQACNNPEVGYDDVAYSITAFETSPISSRFQSKYDAYLNGETTLSQLELRGLDLFDDAAKCSACHVLDADPDLPGPLFTDFTYDNLGVPRNLSNPFYRMDGVDIDGEPINPEGFDWIDPGLGGFIEQLVADDAWRTQPYVPDAMLALSDAELSDLAAASRGKHKVPTLRNVELRPFPSFEKSYTHNGYFNTLAGLVHFYNTRDVLPTCVGEVPESVALDLGCWPAPEVAENINTDEMGDLGLTEDDEAALVAFIETLSDQI